MDGGGNARWMRFHTRRLPFTTAEVERSSLYRGNMLFLIFYFLARPSPSSRSPRRARAERKDPGGKHALYILGGSAYFVYPLFIVGSLPLFFCCVLPVPGLLAAHRLPSLLSSPSLSLSLSLDRRREVPRNIARYSPRRSYRSAIARNP